MAEQSYWDTAVGKRLSRRRFIAGTAAAGGAGVILMACGSGGNGAGSSSSSSKGTEAPSTSSIVNGKEDYLNKTPVSGGVLRGGVGTDPITWDPHQTTSINTHTRTLMFNTPLVSYRFGPKYGSDDVTPSANIASSWEQVDPQTISFKIDPNANFSTKAPLNGRRVTSADIAYTYNRILKLPAPYANLYEPIERMETPDDNTFVLKLKQPYAPIMNFLAHYYAQIIPREVVEQFGDLKTVESAKVLGNGPFVLDSFQAAQSIQYSKRANYKPLGERKGPFLDKVSQNALGDANAAQAAFLAGQVEAGSMTYDNRANILGQRPDLIVFENLSVVAWLITFRTDSPPTNDERVRQAVALGVDRQSWLQGLYSGHGAIDNGPIQALWTEWRVAPDKLGEGSKYYQYDVAQAKALLSAAGVDNLKVDFRFTNGYGDPIVQHTDLLRDMLSKIGIQLDINIMEYAAFVGSVMNSNPNYKSMSYAGVRFMGDPDEALWDMFHPTGSKNFSKINDPALNDLLVKQRTTIDVQARKNVVSDIQKYLAVKNYYVYTPANSTLNAWNPWYANYRPHVSYDTGNNLANVWIDNSLKKS